MNRLSVNARVIYALAALFALMMIFFIGSYIMSASKWASYPTNRHIFISGRLTYAGSVYDADGEILATSAGGERLYLNSKAAREAVLHTVGDSEGYIAAGIQSVYKSSLAGYNLINGVFKLGDRQKGNNITLTLRSAVCTAAYKALGDRRGTVGVYNYKTGEIICMTSSPSFDPENKPDIGDGAEYEGIYINRLLSASYTPGSVFKIVTAAAALKYITGCADDKYTCAGTLELDGGVITCPQAHGEMSFATAFSRSCNCVFARLAADIGSERLTSEAERLGFNKKYRTDNISVMRSVFDVGSANEYELGWAGVGQYTSTANPLQMMYLMGAIANGGTPVKPYIISKIEAPFGLTLHTGRASAQPRMLDADISEELQKIMRGAVVNNYGKSGFAGLTVCGKTGTAQVGSDKLPHAWFAGYTLDEEMPLAFVAVVENGGAGSDAAIPVIKKTLTELVK